MASRSSSRWSLAASTATSSTPNLPRSFGLTVNPERGPHDLERIQSCHLRVALSWWPRRSDDMNALVTRAGGGSRGGAGRRWRSLLSGLGAPARHRQPVPARDPPVRHTLAPRSPRSSRARALALLLVAML